MLDLSRGGQGEAFHRPNGKNRWMRPEEHPSASPINGYDADRSSPETVTQTPPTPSPGLPAQLQRPHLVGRPSIGKIQAVNEVSR